MSAKRPWKFHPAMIGHITSGMVLGWLSCYSLYSYITDPKLSLYQHVEYFVMIPLIFWLAYQCLKGVLHVDEGSRASSFIFNFLIFIIPFIGQITSSEGDSGARALILVGIIGFASSIIFWNDYLKKVVISKCRLGGALRYPT